MVVMSSGGSSRLSRRGSQPRRSRRRTAATASVDIAFSDPVERVDPRVLDGDTLAGRPPHDDAIDAGGGAESEVETPAVLCAEATGGRDFLQLTGAVPLHF